MAARERHAAAPRRTLFRACCSTPPRNRATCLEIYPRPLDHHPSRCSCQNYSREIFKVRVHFREVLVCPSVYTCFRARVPHRSRPFCLRLSLALSSPIVDYERVEDPREGQRRGRRISGHDGPRISTKQVKAGSSVLFPSLRVSLRFKLRIVFIRRHFDKGFQRVSGNFVD